MRRLRSHLAPFVLAQLGLQMTGLAVSATAICCALPAAGGTDHDDADHHGDVGGHDAMPCCDHAEPGGFCPMHARPGTAPAGAEDHPGDEGCAMRAACDVQDAALLAALIGPTGVVEAPYALAVARAAAVLAVPLAARSPSPRLAPFPPPPRV